MASNTRWCFFKADNKLEMLKKVGLVFEGVIVTVIVIFIVFFFSK